MFRLLFLLFVCVPLVELYVLIHVGSYFGAPVTVALCLFTAALGALLFRHQGLATLAAVQARLEQGEMPATELVGGLILLLAGVLLLTPGLLTDVFGFCCLLPGFRHWLANGLLGQALRQQQQRSQQRRVIMEGEYWVEDERRRPGE